MTRTERISSAEFQERFWSKVKKTDGCWEWMGTRGLGYGSVQVNGRAERAHRVAFFIANGHEGVMICHHCDHRPCVRPDHLYAGDAKTNAQDMVRRSRQGNLRKTRCIKGHEYTPENTAVVYDRRGKSRYCLACRADARKLTRAVRGEEINRLARLSRAKQRAAKKAQSVAA